MLCCKGVITVLGFVQDILTRAVAPRARGQKQEGIASMKKAWLRFAVALAALCMVILFVDQGAKAETADSLRLTVEGGAQATAGVGDRVRWQLRLRLPQGQAWELRNPLDERLRYVAGSLRLALGDRPLAATAYTAVEPAREEGGELRLSLHGGDLAGKALTLSYTTALNSRLAQNFDGEVSNAVLLRWQTGGAQQSRLSNTARVQAGCISVVAFDPSAQGTGVAAMAGPSGAARDYQKLPGACFKLYRTREDALADRNAVRNPDGSGKERCAVTGADGRAYFMGLAYGEYWLVKTSAPQGYQEDTAPRKLVLAPRGSDRTLLVQSRQRRSAVPQTGDAAAVPAALCCAAVAWVLLGALHVYKRQQ